MKILAIVATVALVAVLFGLWRAAKGPRHTIDSLKRPIRDLLNRGFDGGLLFITVPGRQDFLQLVKRIERPGVYGIQVHFPRAAWSESYFEAVKAHAERNGLSIFETQVTGESPLRFLIVEFGKDPDAAHDFVQYVLREVFSANEKRGFFVRLENADVRDVLVDR